MLIAIARKYAVAQVVGLIKGKSAIHLSRVYAERKRNFVGQHFWARGYFVSTVGPDEQVMRVHPQAGTGRRALGPAGIVEGAWTPLRWRLVVRAM